MDLPYVEATVLERKKYHELPNFDLDFLFLVADGIC